MTEAPSVPDSRKRLRFVGIFAIYAVVTTLMAPLFFIFGPFFPRFYYPYAQSWTQMFIELCGAKVRIHGLDRPDWERPAV
ncbi:hypothetical protein KDL45_13790, partial [bacterium]|nr:hypothetical protein [bacterium]